MNTQKPPHFPSARRQPGIITIAIVLILLLSLTFIALTTSRTAMVEQQITGNDMRAREAFESAEANMEWSLAYLTNDKSFSNYKGLAWADDPSGKQISVPNANTGDLVTDQDNFSYSFQVRYERRPGSNFIKIISTTNETSDNSITATSEQYVKAASIFDNNPGFNPPPLLMDGCLSDVLGTPDIYIGARADGVAAGTSKSPVNQGAWGDGNDTDNSCLKQGHLNAHGGQPKGEIFTNGQLWQYVFGNYTRAQIQAKANAEVAAGVPDDQRTYIWVTDSGNFHDSWGSPDQPVILVFASSANCPKINGNPTIYGLVFVDSACDSANGWGGATIYGTAIINGNTSKLTANTAIHDWSSSGSGNNNLPTSYVDGIYKIPGTWKDF